MTNSEYLIACGRNVALNLNLKDKAQADYWRAKFRTEQATMPEDDQRKATQYFYIGYNAARII